MRQESPCVAARRVEAMVGWARPELPRPPAGGHRRCGRTGRVASALLCFLAVLRTSLSPSAFLGGLSSSACTSAQRCRLVVGVADAAPCRQSSRLALGATYKALAKIRVRIAPDVAAASLADGVSAKLQSGEWIGTLEPGQVFEVEETRQKGDQKYLKLAGQDGWVFTRGIAGQWAGKDIMVPVNEKEVAEAKAQSFVGDLERKLFRDESDRFAVVFLLVVVVITIVVNVFVLTG
mmetsp:Transcript_102091/g.263973  ORF Transcript_102091/g.263973 Transcript_102091/m.263973 type:complete len:235 (+) Transcript_102091:133-837(+)